MTQVIQIEHKFRPFSHLPGTKCPVPGSDYEVEVFPTKIKIPGAPDVTLPFTKPVKDFTVQLDLERQCIFIWGQAPEGYFRLKLEALEEGLVLTGLRGLKFRQVIAGGGKTFGPATERLFLGCTKAQDWELMRKRCNSQELGPMLFFLGQQVPCTDTVSISEFTPMHMLPGAHGVYTQTRKLLIDDTHILPALPPEWHVGRATGLRMDAGTIDLEWTRNTLRRMVFHPSTDKPVDFVFPKQIRSFRCTKQNNLFLYDRFQK